MNQCLPCFSDCHDWCVVHSKLIGMSHTCDCPHPSHARDSDGDPAADDHTDPDD